VHGTVTLQDSGGSISIRPEQYTFEQHNVTSAGDHEPTTYCGYEYLRQRLFPNSR
jgi:hypothetical protein